VPNTVGAVVGRLQPPWLVPREPAPTSAALRERALPAGGRPRGRHFRTSSRSRMWLRSVRRGCSRGPGCGRAGWRVPVTASGPVTRIWRSTGCPGTAAPPDR